MKPADIAQRLARPRIASPARIFVDALQLNDADKKAGEADGLASRHWSPGDRDEFSYALGFAAGRDKARRSKGG